MKHFAIMFGQSNIYFNLDGKKNVEWELTELFETINKKYKSEYDIDLDGEIVLSINGNLYKVYYHCCGAWECVTTNDNFICASKSYYDTPVCLIASALLNYDENITPQDVLNTTAKVTTNINTELIKIENVEYK